MCERLIIIDEGRERGRGRETGEREDWRGGLERDIGERGQRDRERGQRERGGE